MARPREPLNLIEAKGRKHLTIQEKEERGAQEVRAPSDRITAPKYLSREEKKTFNFIARTLKDIGIVSNLDTGIIARYVKSESEYIKITEQMDAIVFEIDPGNETPPEEQLMILYSKYNYLSKIQNRYMKACNECARELGLTISSRCKLVMPKPKDEKPKNKYMVHA